MPDALTDNENTEENPHFQWGVSLRDQTVIFIVCLILTGWVIFRWVDLSLWNSQEVIISRQTPLHYQYELDINEATWIEFALLDGVGEVLGKRIVEYRETNGPFQKIENLREVNGIGAKTLEKMRRWLVVTTPGKTQE